MIMVVKESWLDPNQSELETTKIINVKKKKVKEAKSMEPRTRVPPQLSSSVYLKRHVTARRPTEKKRPDRDTVNK